jgi:transposase-like protein
MAAPKFTSQMTIAQFDRLFPTDDACKDYLAARRWPKGVRCPQCGSDRVYALKTMPFKWECPACSPKGYRFSVLVGTIFENTNVGLKTWFKVIYLMLTSKKGISALQIHRMMGFGSYSTALYMCHRVRAGLANPEFRKLVGIVEVDETLRIFGRARYNDVFTDETQLSDKKHVYNFCWDVHQIVFSDDGKSARFSYSLCDEGNCTDNECKFPPYGHAVLPIFQCQAEAVSPDSAAEKK